MNEVEERVAIDEAALKALLKQEIERLKEGAIRAEEIDDDEPLFSIPGEFESRIELDSLDALELAFAVEQATGMAQPEEWRVEELMSVAMISVFVDVAMWRRAEGRSNQSEYPRESE